MNLISNITAPQQATISTFKSYCETKKTPLKTVAYNGSNILSISDTSNSFINLKVDTDLSVEEKSDFDSFIVVCNDLIN